MSTHDYLKLQVRLLVVEFGRRPVLEAFAAASEAPPDQIQDELSRREANNRSKALKQPKSIDAIIAGIPMTTDSQRQAIASLGRLYESRQFLPNLRDAEEFLRRSGALLKKQKSRKDALPLVLKALSGIAQSELDSILADATRSPGQSDYAILAKQLMGKPD
jgi:hypothetical protein